MDISTAFVKRAVIGVVSLLVAIILFTQAFFYAEPGYLYHVRTIFGTEKVVNDTGYAGKWFGKVTEWKKAITVQTVISVDPNEETEESTSVRTVPGVRITFLGNVDAAIEATSRFRIPESETEFLKMVREYRTPDNLTATALIPALKDTLQSTSSLMTADDFYAGGRAQFSADFEQQLRNGTFIVRRVEERNDTEKFAPQTAIAGQGTDQGQYGDSTRSNFRVEKILGTDGRPLAKDQTYTKYGIALIEARVTNVVPNVDFQARMKKVQEGMAATTIARQERIKEEEAKLTVIAKGEREREEKRQAALMEQAVKTTNAETEKQLILTQASQRKEQAALDNQTAQLLLDKAALDAQAQKTTADAEAYARQKAITADDGLQAKLDALVKINEAWATAAQQANVPSVVMGGGSGSRQSEIADLMSVLSAKAAKDLAADIELKKQQ